MAENKSDDGTVLYIKIGGGSLIINKPNGRQKRIKPGERFRMRPEEVPENFKDLIQPVFPAEEKEVKEKTATEVVKPTYVLKHRGGGWYNVEDQNGKVVNEAALKKAGAEALISSLT